MLGMFIETVCGAIMIVPCILLMGKLREMPCARTAMYCIFAVYLSGIYFLTGLPTVQFHTFDNNVNLIPFGDMLSDLKNSILNILLFIPMGFLLPTLWKEFRKMKQLLVFSCCVTLAIELLQLFTFRATDVNDMVTNLLGAVIGYLLYRTFREKIPSGGQNEHPIGELWWVLLITMGIMFFVYPYLVSGIYMIM